MNYHPSSEWPKKKWRQLGEESGWNQRQATELMSKKKYAGKRCTQTHVGTYWRRHGFDYTELKRDLGKAWQKWTDEDWLREAAVYENKASRMAEEHPDAPSFEMCRRKLGELGIIGRVGGPSTSSPIEQEARVAVKAAGDRALKAEKEAEALRKQLYVTELQARKTIHEWTGERIRIGGITDTHLGSRYYDPSLLQSAYDEFEAQKVDVVLHAGDMVAGEKVYMGQEYDNYAQGFEAQLRDVVENYPRADNFQTYFITGNHDLSYWKRMGADIGRAISEQRPDLVYKGMESHDLELGHVIFRLAHPGKGTAYALCYSADTRILTRDRGWRLFSELEGGDAVATLNPETNQLEWQLPSSRPVYEYSGPMVQFGGGSGHCYDMRVTPDHQMWVARPWGENNSGRRRGISPPGFHFVRAGQITNSRQYKLQRWANWQGSEEPIRLPPAVMCEPRARARYVEEFVPEAFAEFLGWYLSEGCVNKANGNIEIAQWDEKNRQRIADCIRHLGFHVTFTKTKVVTTGKQLRQYLAPLGLSHEKYIPPEIKGMSRRLLCEHFLSAYWDGDGNRHTDGRFHSASTTSKRLAGDLLEVLLKVGLSGTYSVREPSPAHYSKSLGRIICGRHKQYQISVAHKQLEPEIWAVSATEYSGRVYCVTVPQHHIVLVMRNGKPCWSGNSYHPQKHIESLSGGEKPHIILFGHWHKVEYLFYRNVHAFQCGTFERQTPFMRRMNIAAMLGFWILDIYQNESGIAKVVSQLFPAYEGEGPVIVHDSETGTGD